MFFNERLYHLLSIPSITFPQVKWIIEHTEELNQLYEPAFVSSFNKKFPNSTNISSHLQSSSILHTINQFLKENGKIITIFDLNYPKYLKEIYQPPLILFAKGKVEWLNNENICGMVGSRDCSNYSEQVVKYIIPSLVKKEIMTVSGLAKGVDYLVHSQTVQNGGKTIAVIAGGLNHIYPKQHIAFARYLMEEQLILSEYLPNIFPQKWHFPHRNRIISGLSKALVVIEAKARSGSLITANYALQEGRMVLAVPGSIFNDSSKGCNELIGAGAKIITKIEDILEEFANYY